MCIGKIWIEKKWIEKIWIGKIWTENKFVKILTLKKNPTVDVKVLLSKKILSGKKFI